MKAIITKVFELNEEDISTYMKHIGYDDYTEDDVDNELYSIDVEDCVYYGIEKHWETDVRIV